MLTVTLVPLSLGELLDQTFSYFRKHFWLFAGIMVLPEGWPIGLNILVQIYLSSMALPQNPRSHQATAQSVANAMRAGLAYFGILIPYFIVYALALGAATYALSARFIWGVRRLFTSLTELFNIGLGGFLVSSSPLLYVLSALSCWSQSCSYSR